MLTKYLQTLTVKKNKWITKITKFKKSFQCYCAKVLEDLIHFRFGWKRMDTTSEKPDLLTDLASGKFYGQTHDTIPLSMRNGVGSWIRIQSKLLD
jgi:hypothetical protein